MGGAPVRITPADFVTPPELRGYRLAAEGAGRVGGVRAELGLQHDSTRLQSCYQQVPLRMLPPFTPVAGGPALLYLLNPTAGLLDSDGQLVELRAGTGTHAVIVGQSATRIHPALHGFCTQQWKIHVEAGAVLVLLPGPAIPFAGSRYYQRVAVSLEEGAGFVWGDVWLAGRYARQAASEQFAFRLLVQDLEVRRDGRLVFRDRFCWQGPWDAETAAWHFGNDVACGNLFLTGPADFVCSDGPTSVRHAVLPTAAGDSCCRWHGPPEAVTQCVVGAALGAAAKLAGGADEPWLGQGHALGPNHWFSAVPRRGTS
jgi:urease accessory protein